MKLSKQQLKTSTRHYIKKCAGAVCTSKLHESARNSARNEHSPLQSCHVLRVWSDKRSDSCLLTSMHQWLRQISMKLLFLTPLFYWLKVILIVIELI